ncbi:hypothetical protein [Ruegeria sp. R14_0]|uniref:hypothetical protein n=1 Tax=Ruegeria sp. R14_0 TaxID=2821100 RepID=UPI001ADCAB27|nr:hypothetical protein [Ruegeria sp. R14_0]MBO9444768.1 hypothetical protein [Ruegeria sp. R14_0]
MKNISFRAFKFGLRAQGKYAILVSALLLAGLINGLPEGHSIGYPVVCLILAAFCGIVMGIPRFTPSWLSDPKGILRGGCVFILSSVVLILYIVVGMLSVVVWEIPEPLSRSLAMLACLPTVLFTNIFGWSALIYGILPDPDQPGPRARSAAPPATEPAADVDLRNLRHSRMSR